MNIRKVNPSRTFETCIRTNTKNRKSYNFRNLELLSEHNILPSSIPISVNCEDMDFEHKPEEPQQVVRKEHLQKYECSQSR